MTKFWKIDHLGAHSKIDFLLRIIGYYLEKHLVKFEVVVRISLRDIN